MSLTRRLSLVTGLLAAAVAVNYLLLAHLAQSRETAFPELRSSLEALPPQLPPDVENPEWVGQEHPNRAAVAKQAAFADEMVYRAYRSQAGQFAVVYAAYSRQGEDRNHHPEICIREVNGAPEDRDERKAIPLADDERLAQRFRFRVEGGRLVYVYYWHYTIAPTTQRESILRIIHRQLVTSPPSITVQVSTSASGADLKSIEDVLLPACDRAFRERLLPEGTRVGHDRIPVILLRR